MKIEFFDMNNTIPTELCLKVNDTIQVYYHKLTDGRFGYDFKMYRVNDKNQSIAIINKIIDIMESQSFDHGQEWVKVTVECEEPKEIWEPYKYRVFFRIRDSY